MGFEMRTRKCVVTVEAPEIGRRDGANAGDAHRSCACGAERPERFQVAPGPGGDQGGPGQAEAALGTGRDRAEHKVPRLGLFFPLRISSKIPLKLDAELPAPALANCIYAGIRVLLLKFM